MTWTIQNRDVTDEDVEGYEAFVYVITHLGTGRRYVGKKILLRKVTKKPLKGKSKRRHSKVKSDWETYWGSNKELLAEVQELGPESFSREILRLCRSRGEANYWEAKYQFDWRVLENPDHYYNEWIMVKVHRSHVSKKKI
jgi:hypothetical protein